MKKLIILFLASFLFGNINSFLEKASVAIKNGNYEEALIHVNKAQNENLKNPDLYRMEALIFEMLDEPKKAKKSMEKMSKIFK